MTSCDGAQFDLISELLTTLVIYADLTDAKLKNLVMNLLALVNKGSLSARAKVS